LGILFKSLNSFINYKFKPKTDKSKKVVEEIEKFLDCIDIEYGFDGTIPQKGDYVQFQLDDLNVPEEYEEEFEKLSDDAKKYFDQFCLNEPLKVHSRIFCGYIYIKLLVKEYFIFD
jgi:hypothetical protein